MKRELPFLPSSSFSFSLSRPGFHTHPRKKPRRAQFLIQQRNYSTGKVFGARYTNRGRKFGALAMHDISLDRILDRWSLVGGRMQRGEARFRMARLGWVGGHLLRAKRMERGRNYAKPRNQHCRVETLLNKESQLLITRERFYIHRFLQYPPVICQTFQPITPLSGNRKQ